MACFLPWVATKPQVFWKSNICDSVIHDVYDNYHSNNSPNLGRSLRYRSDHTHSNPEMLDLSCRTKSYKNLCKQKGELLLPWNNKMVVTFLSYLFLVKYYLYTEITQGKEEIRRFLGAVTGHQTLQWRYKHKHKVLQVCYMKETCTLFMF